MFYLQLFVGGFMSYLRYFCLFAYSGAGLIKPDEVGDFFALVSMKLPNFCQKAKF